MISQKRSSDKYEEFFLIYEHAKCLGISSALIETPINSVSERQLRNGQSIPDALFLHNGAKIWVESTTFSRCQAMRVAMGEAQKKIGEYQGLRMGIPPGEWGLAWDELRKAISKKLKKDYSQFAELTQSHPMGHLIVAYMIEDPFLTVQGFLHFIELVSDEYVLFSWEIDKGQFEAISVMAFVPNYNKGCWEWVTVKIADKDTMCRLKEWRLRKDQLVYRLLMSLIV